MVDIARPASVARTRRTRWIAGGAIVAVTVGTASVVLARLAPASPEVDRGMVWTDTVRRGPMLRSVRGIGTLTPENIRWIPATTAGRVERIRVRPGATVTPETVVLDLSNPEEVQGLAEAEAQARAASAELASLRARLEDDLVAQEATALVMASEFAQASLRAQMDGQLAARGLQSELEARLSALRAESLRARALAERRRLDRMSGSVEAQLAVQQAAVERLRAGAALKRAQVAALRVQAGVAGILQLVPVEVGQHVAPGTNLARVADPCRLKAELRVPESQARDVRIGLAASIDTHNGVVIGRVVRVDPAVQGGTVTVDVALDAELPPGARPDLSIDGTIELERLADVLYVGRPVLGREMTTVGLFRVGPDGVTAERVKVALGRTAVNAVEIKGGLQAGDQVVLSDMSPWDRVDRIRLR
jgi:HlyD family secretion protein